MRKFIVDTDTGSDDAVALMMAALSKDISLLGVTTVCGNVPLEQATQNALMTLEVCESDVQVFRGAEKPLFRELVTAVNVHGNDGMGDLDLIHPKRAACDIHAVDFILDTLKKSDGDIEIVMLGPATNIALAILRDPQTMARAKRIYTMGTAGYGRGNTTPVAEFNVYVDAESYKILLQSGIPLTVIGFDMCTGPAAWNEQEIAALRNGRKTARFAVECNSALLNYNLRRNGSYIIDLPDAVAMSAALWPETATEIKPSCCYCCTTEPPCYGQVILCDPEVVYAIDKDYGAPNADVVTAFDAQTYKQRLARVLGAK